MEKYAHISLSFDEFMRLKWSFFPQTLIFKAFQTFTDCRCFKTPLLIRVLYFKSRKLENKVYAYIFSCFSFSFFFAWIFRMVFIEYTQFDRNSHLGVGTQGKNIYLNVIQMQNFASFNAVWMCGEWNILFMNISWRLFRIYIIFPSRQDLHQSLM